MCFQIQEPESKELGCQGENPLKYFAMNQEAHREEEERAAQPNLTMLALIRS